MMSKAEKKKYWIKFTHYVCVLCGRETEYREYVYDKPKPDDYLKRHIVIEKACGYHFC